MPENKRKPIVVNDKNDPRLKAYTDSLSNYNKNEIFWKNWQPVTQGNAGQLNTFYEPNKVYRKRDNPNLPGYDITYKDVVKKPVQPFIFQKLESIKPLGIKPMDTSVEAKRANNKQEIIQEPMSKKQTYTASPNLKKMSKSTGREYVDGKWIETKSKGGTVKKYVGGGLDLLSSVKPDMVSNLTKPFVSKMPKTTTTPTTPTDTGSNFKLPSLGGGGNSSASQDMSQDPNAPKKKNIGKTIGGIAGGIAGSFIPIPGVGSMVGGAVGSMIGGAIDNKQYKNKVEDYTTTKSSQQNAMTSNIAGNFNPNAQGRQFKKGGELKPMGNDMYEVKSYKKGTDKVEYRPNVFIDNKEIIRKNPDGSTQILSDDLGYAKVAKSLAKAKGGNISDNQFDQLYMAQEMSKTNRGKGNKFSGGGIDKKFNLRNPMSEDRATSVANSNALLMNELKFTPPEVKDEGFVNLDGTTEPILSPYTVSKDLENSILKGPSDGSSWKSSGTPPPPNATKPLDTKVNPLGYLSSLAGPAYTMVKGLKGPDPVNFDRMNTKYQYADPRGAMVAASRGVTSAYNAAKNATRNTATSAGEYLANMGSLASKEGIDRAATIAGIKGQYDMSNTQGLNQSNLMKDQFNAQVQMNESIARQQEKDAARSAVSSGLSNIGQNTMGYTAERDRAKNDRLMAGLLNESYEVVYNKDTDSYEIQPKPGKKKGSNVITPFGEKTEPKK